MAASKKPRRAGAKLTRKPFSFRFHLGRGVQFWYTRDESDRAYQVARREALARKRPGRGK